MNKVKLAGAIFQPLVSKIRFGIWMISTIDGNLHISLDDWVIHGVDGELYRCKPDIFDATHEPAGTIIAEQVGKSRAGRLLDRVEHSKHTKVVDHVKE